MNSGEKCYSIGDYSIVPHRWIEKKWAVTSGSRASYVTHRRVKGYAIHRGAEYIGRCYRLRDARQWVQELREEH